MSASKYFIIFFLSYLSQGTTAQVESLYTCNCQNTLSSTYGSTVKFNNDTWCLKDAHATEWYYNFSDDLSKGFWYIAQYQENPFLQIAITTECTIYQSAQTGPPFTDEQVAQAYSFDDKCNCNPGYYPSPDAKVNGYGSSLGQFNDVYCANDLSSFIANGGRFNCENSGVDNNSDDLEKLNYCQCSFVNNAVSSSTSTMPTPTPSPAADTSPKTSTATGRHLMAGEFLAGLAAFTYFVITGLA